LNFVQHRLCLGADTCSANQEFDVHVTVHR